MAINDVNTPELWVVGFAFIVLAVVTLLEGVALLDVRTLGADESLPAVVTVAGTMLVLWWFDDGRARSRLRPRPRQDRTE